MSIEENFTWGCLSEWQTLKQRSGKLIESEGELCLQRGPENAGDYANAQIDDYQNLSRNQFLWNPPLRMKLEARFSHDVNELKGTAGFGFWNDPFMMTGWRMPSLPKALWFFAASKPSDMQLANGVNGHGFKTGVIDAWRLPFLTLIPLAPLAVPLMLIKSLRDALWPIAQKAMACNETILDHTMTEWHEYEMTWLEDSVHFKLDDEELSCYEVKIRGPLGLVIWIDNQYMVVKPWGKLGHGNIACEQQSMNIRSLSVENL